MWNPLNEVIDYFSNKCSNLEKVLEVGPGEKPFSKATHYIDLMDWDATCNIKT